MTKKERVIAAIKGQPVDRIPSGFWLHFPESCFYGDAAVQAHLKFFRETETDIQKIAQELYALQRKATRGKGLVMA